MKRVGHCSLCLTQVADIKKVFPAGHPFEGLPARLGKWRPNAMRATFVLLDGSQMDLTMCSACMAEMGPEDYPRLWQNVISAFQDELNRLEKADPKNAEKRLEVANRVIASNPPVGLLSSRPWSEIVSLRNG